MSEIDHSPTTPTEQDLTRALLQIYERWRDDLNYRAERFRQMIVPTGNRKAYVGAREAANRMVRGGITGGFARLMLERRVDLSVEALVVAPPFCCLFAPKIRRLAQAKLDVARRYAEAN